MAILLMTETNTKHKYVTENKQVLNETQGSFCFNYQDFSNSCLPSTYITLSKYVRIFYVLIATCILPDFPENQTYIAK